MNLPKNQIISEDQETITFKFTNNDNTFIMDKKYVYLIAGVSVSQTKDDGYARYSMNGKTMYLHKEIVKVRDGNEDIENVDHVDRNTCNNLESNLRPCNRSENQHNKDKQLNNTSGFKGVCWHKNMKKWQAQIKINGKNKHLGYYDNIIDAARAYNNAAKELHGEYAHLNDVDNIKTFVPFNPLYQLKENELFYVPSDMTDELKKLYQERYNIKTVIIKQMNVYINK